MWKNQRGLKDRIAKDVRGQAVYRLMTICRCLLKVVAGLKLLCILMRSRVVTHRSGTNRPREALSKGRIVQGLNCPSDVASKGRIDQGTHRPGEAFLKRCFVQETHRPRDASTKGRTHHPREGIGRGTRPPRDASSMGHIVRETHHPRDALSIVHWTEHPRLFVFGHNVMSPKKLSMKL